MFFIQHWKFKSYQIHELMSVFEMPPTPNSHPPAMQGARPSAATVLTWFSWNNLALVSVGLCLLILVIVVLYNGSSHEGAAVLLTG